MSKREMPIEPSLKELQELQKRKMPEMKLLLEAAKRRLPELKTLLAEVSDHWGYEDSIYRFYHHSFKVYRVQAMTQQIVAELQALAPHLKLNEDFLQIVREGTGKQFELAHNENWLAHTRPIVEAFLHARHILAMLSKYADELETPPQVLPSGLATVLYLYNLR